jgi:GT2 family glycosyltransferase
VDGRAGERRGVITGWARVGWNPGAPVDLLIRDQHGHSVRLQAGQPLPESRWRFQLDVRKAGLEGGKFEIFVRLPDGSRQPLPDSPLLSASEARMSLRTITPRASHGRARTRYSRSVRPPVSVIIPVYGDREATRACIEAVCSTVAGAAAAIIVVDDASPDPGLASDLDALAASKKITLIRNPTNRGFSASVNRAMALQDRHDVVLINSDAVVFHDWLSRLREAAYSGPRIGTATPFADDDSIAGYRQAGGGTVASAELLDRNASAVNRGIREKIPVGVGFCLYIRRDCLWMVGAFDEAAFGPGYGEEADFCMRARKKGWQHVLAADVFVHHAGAGSFGSRRTALFDRAQRLLNLRHPGYDRAVARFASKDPLHLCRRRLDEARLRSFQGRMVLIMTVARTGGIDRIIAERCRQIRLEGRLPLILRPLTIDDADACVLRCEEMGFADLHFENNRELPSLVKLLQSLPIDAIEFHHFLGLDPRVVIATQRLGVPYDAYIHDYSWICPRITLIDGSGTYCGEPAVSVCERCIQRNGSVLFETISVRALRQRSRRWLGAARRVIAPSQDTAERLRRYMPELAVDVVPHEIFMVRNPRRPESEPGVTRVAVLGAIGHQKGYKILLECARDALARKLNLEFVVIGYTEDDAKLTKTGKIFVTGEYADGEIGQLLQRERPSAIFLPSVWPETWSFTLSHAITSGLPVVAFDLGAIAERLRAEGIGDLLPLGLPAGAINDHLMGLPARG